MTSPRDPRSALFGAASRGDASALDGLLVDYLPRLEAFVRARIGVDRIGCESCADVVQSVCREVVGQRGVFEFRGEAEFRSWLFTSTLNKIRSKYRFHRAARRDGAREEAMPEPGSDDEGNTPSGGATPSRIAAAKDDLARLVAAIDRLLPDHREVIALARIAELPLEVVAVQMDRSVPAVRQLLARALIKLAEQVEPRPE